MKKNTAEPKDLWEKEDVAKHLGVSVSTVNRLMRKGVIPFLKLGHKTVRFKPDDVRAQLEKKCTIVNSVRARLAR